MLLRLTGKVSVQIELELTLPGELRVYAIAVLLELVRVRLLVVKETEDWNRSVRPVTIEPCFVVLAGWLPSLIARTTLGALVARPSSSEIRRPQLDNGS